ncbi:MAG: hypothetical protein OXN17_08330 [Candidatus Poribacteria bacterium]|nr:hypothetical protein [Candidatus Poribacteria bacterium]MDE0503575.1 hypothetical protein [Candidatus Poribacteria bacterium]
MSREVLQDFDDGHGLTEAQRNTLGIWVPDAEDGHWIYGQYWENGGYKTGHVVRHAAGADLLSDTDGAVSDEVAVGANYLVTDGKFANKDFRGAVGYIYDGTGAGQTFYIRRMIPGDDDRVEIGVLSSVAQRPRTQGWDIALDNTSKFRLWLPGRFYFSDGAATDLTAGVCQTELTVTDDYKPFGWAKCEGGAFALQDDDATNRLTQNGPVLQAANGLVEGVPASIAAGAIGGVIARTIGRADFAPLDHASDTDTLVSVTLDNIPRRRASFSREDEGHSGNRVNIV